MGIHPYYERTEFFIEKESENVVSIDNASNQKRLQGRSSSWILIFNCRCLEIADNLF